MAQRQVLVEHLKEECVKTMSVCRLAVWYLLRFIMYFLLRCSHSLWNNAGFPKKSNLTIEDDTELQDWSFGIYYSGREMEVTSGGSSWAQSTENPGTQRQMKNLRATCRNDELSNVFRRLVCGEVQIPRLVWGVKSRDNLTEDKMAKNLIKIDIVSDTVCPWCFIGKKYLEKAMRSCEDKFDFEVILHLYAEFGHNLNFQVTEKSTSPCLHIHVWTNWPETRPRKSCTPFYAPKLFAYSHVSQVSPV